MWFVALKEKMGVGFQFVIVQGVIKLFDKVLVNWSDVVYGHLSDDCDFLVPMTKGVVLVAMGCGPDGPYSLTEKAFNQVTLGDGPQVEQHRHS